MSMIIASICLTAQAAKPPPVDNRRQNTPIEKLSSGLRIDGGSSRSPTERFLSEKLISRLDTLESTKGSIEQAISRATSLRAQIGTLRGTMLERNEKELRSALESLTGSGSVMDGDEGAPELTEYVKEQMPANAEASLQAQSNADSNTVFSLLGEG